MGKPRNTPKIVRGRMVNFTVRQPGSAVDVDLLEQKFWLINATLDHRLRAGARTLAVILCEYINRSEDHRLRGWAWPAQETLAEDLSVHNRTVRGWISELQSYGHIEQVSDGRRTNMIRLRWTKHPGPKTEGRCHNNVVDLRSDRKIPSSERNELPDDLTYDPAEDPKDDPAELTGRRAKQDPTVSTPAGSSNMSGAASRREMDLTCAKVSRRILNALPRRVADKTDEKSIAVAILHRLTKDDCERFGPTPAARLCNLQDRMGEYLKGLSPSYDVHTAEEMIRYDLWDDEV